MVNSMIKIKYSISIFNIVTCKSNIVRTVELANNGELLLKDYFYGSRKIKEKQQYFVGELAVSELYAKLRECIDTANDLEITFDDMSAELKIYHTLERIEIIPSGVRNDINTIDHIIQDFISKYEEKTK